MKKIIILFLVLLLLIGCEEQTIQEKAQNKLIKELDWCDTKYGEGENARAKNQDYCNQILKEVNKLSENDCLIEKETAKKTIEKKDLSLSTKTEEERDYGNEIIGEI